MLISMPGNAEKVRGAGGIVAIAAANAAMTAIRQEAKAPRGAQPRAARGIESVQSPPYYPNKEFL